MKKWWQIGSRIKSQLGGRWTYPFVISCLVFALLGDFIANEVPIVCKYEGKIYFPVLRKVGTDLGLHSHHPVLRFKNYEDTPFEWQLNPLIPYDANSLDTRNDNFRSPFEKQDVKGLMYRHWMGTDLLGRDVLAGMIAGVRVAIFVGLLSVFIATIIGLMFGMIAGYFGNHTKASIALSFAVCLGLGCTFLGGSIIFPIWQNRTPGFITFLEGFLLGIVISCLVYLVLKQSKVGQRKIFWMIDSLILQLIKWFRSIPGIFLLMAMIPLFSYTGIITISVIIGLLRWPIIAQYTRAEMLKIRNLPYMLAAVGFGLSSYRILSRHALPNVIYPIIIHAAFGISAAILLESTLSFLGLGLGVDKVTWGTLLEEARGNFAAWWMAVFPGLALFFTVVAFNSIGDQMLKSLNPHHEKLEKE